MQKKKMFRKNNFMCKKKCFKLNETAINYRERLLLYKLISKF